MTNEPVALVTGCSSGFGEAIARNLASRGYQVVATMRRPDEASEPLRASGCRVAALDVNDAASRQQVIDDIVATFARLDVLVNNAGFAQRGSVEDTDEAQLRAVMNTNFHGPVALTRLALPLMRRQRSGRIVNVTAIGALLCSPFLSAYCASKHAMDAVTAALDVEVRGLGIRASSVLPGQFKTAIGSNMVHAPIGEDYRGVSEVLSAKFQQRAAEAGSDFQPVLDAVLHAVEDEEPQQRYVVGGGSALLLTPLVAELQGIHDIELARAHNP